MPFGAGLVAAQRGGAAAVIDPRPYAVGSLAETYERYPHIGSVLPAMGYSDEQLLERVPEKTDYLVSKLNGLCDEHPTLAYNVRGLGLYQGFSLREPSHKGKLVNDALDNEDLLILGAGTHSIRLRPPLDVTTADIDLLVEKLGRCLKRLPKAAQAELATAGANI